MSVVTFVQKGNFLKTQRFLRKSFGLNYRSILEKYAQQGVRALSEATPVDTGKTAASWDYEIIQDGSALRVIWKNYNVQGYNVNIALILQLGHGTGTGGYVTGIDYINPALRPIFEEMADAAWKEVTSI